jgi:hypothetical protein
MARSTAARQGTSLLASLAHGAANQGHVPPASAVRSHYLDEATPRRGRGSQRAPLAAVAQDPQSTFSSADKALIRRVHGYMSHSQLLGVLNERLRCDRGPAVTLFTVEQLKAEIDCVTGAVPHQDDWGSLRRILAKARRDGVLEQITETIIHDFAIVYALTHRQLITLKDVLLQSDKESEE